MPTATLSSFDTLAYVKRLKAADVPEKQAEAQAEALRAALDTQDVATKGDLRELELRLRGEIEGLRKDIIIKLGGMLIAGFGLVLAVLLK